MVIKKDTYDDSRIRVKLLAMQWHLLQNGFDLSLDDVCLLAKMCGFRVIGMNGVGKVATISPHMIAIALANKSSR